MKLAEVKTLAEQRGIVVGTMKKADLVRAIQVNEGNTACFGTGSARNCGQLECLWRPDCSK